MRKITAAIISIFLSTTVFAQIPKVQQSEAEHFARRLESGVNNKDYRMLDILLDTDAFTRRISENSEVPFSPAFIEGFKSGLNMKDFSGKIKEQLEAGGQFHFIRYYVKNNKPRILFRLVTEGLNYFDYELIKVKDSIRAADVLVYTTGEELSKTMADILGTLASSETKKVNKSVDGMNKLKKLLAEGKNAEARKLYDKLDNDLKLTKAFLLINIRISEGTGMEDYRKALEAYSNIFPDEATSYLLMIDAYFLDKDYTKAMQAVDGLDSLLQGDPYLHFYRGLIYSMKGDTANSRLSYEKVLAAEPGHANVIIELIAIYAEAGQTDKAKDMLERYKQTKQFDREVLEGLKILYPALFI